MAARILIVDDDANLLSGLVRHLRKSWVVDVSESPRDGLEALALEPAYAVIVSDYQMPGMNGIEFLTHARDLAPDASRILLTGHSQLDMAIRAINQGQIFRFLAKPCDIGILELAIRSGERQYQLLQSERVLLEQTLTGSVDAMIGLLGHLDTAAFHKAQRITLLVRKLACELNILDLWALTVAAPMSQLAQLSLPLALVDKQRRRIPLSDQESADAREAFEVMADVLDKVPRLGPVAELLRRLAPPQSRPPISETEIGAGSSASRSVQILQASMEFIDALDQVPQASEALRTFQGEAWRFDPTVIEALTRVTIRDTGLARETRQIRTLDPTNLRLGHLLVDPLRTKSGRIVHPAGCILDQDRLDAIQDMRVILDTSTHVKVIEHLSS